MPRPATSFVYKDGPWASRSAFASSGRRLLTPSRTACAIARVRRPPNAGPGRAEIPGVAGGGEGTFPIPHAASRPAQVRAVYERCLEVLDGGAVQPLGETFAAVHAAELALARELSCPDNKGGSERVRACCVFVRAIPISHFVRHDVTHNRSYKSTGTYEY